MERRPRFISYNVSYTYREDLRPIGRDRSGKPLSGAEITQLLEFVPKDKMGDVACGSVDSFQVRPQEIYNILNFIGNADALDQFRVWCTGKGFKLREEADLDEFQRFERARQLLAEEEELINHLSPYVNQLQMARILELRRYRTADEQIKQTLISGTYRLLGEYLGPRRSYKRDMEEPKLLPLPDLPIELFEDGLVAEILTEAQRTAALEIFNQSVTDGFAYLDSLKKEAKNPAQVQFVENLESYFRTIDDWQFPDVFRRTIAGAQKDVPEDQRTATFPFPSFHQKEYAYRFTHKTTDIGMKDLLVGDTRTQKTKSSILAMEAAEAKHTLVVCPPGIPVNDWAKEVREAYEEDVEVVTIVGTDELRRLVRTAQDKRPRYIIIGYSLLSTLGINDNSFKLLSELVQKAGIDSLIDDEAHLANNYDATCTQLMHHISRLLPKDTPRIAMTATAVVNGVEDLDSPVRILLPFDYPNEGDFTRAARNNPSLVSAELYGKGLLTRWNKYSILKGKLPDLRVSIEPVPLTLFHKALYDFIYHDDFPEGVTKRQILRQLSLDPMLVRRFYSPEGVTQMIGKLKTRLTNNDLDDKTRAKIESQIKGLEDRARNLSSIYTVDQAQKDLSEANQQFINWKLSQNSDEVFDEDFLTKIGFENLAIWAFFNLPNGVDTLIRTSSDRSLQENWTGKEDLYSSKYIHLKKRLDSLVAEGKSKIEIFSAFYATSVTTPLEEVVVEDDLSAFFSLYDYLRIWYGENIPRIDGNVSAHPKQGEISARERARLTIRLDPTNILSLLTIRSSRLGIDLTIPPIKANERFERVYQFHLDEPDTFVDKKQTWGRNEGPGQTIPIEAITLRTTNPEEPTNIRYGFFDEGNAEALEFKRLISQMVLDAIPLTDDEENFVRAHTKGTFIQNLYPMTPRMYLINRFFPAVRGQGYEKNRQFLKQIGFEGISNADFFATYYPKDDEYSLAGHNARVVSQVIKKFKEGVEGEVKIASVGSGASILQIMLGEKVLNIDMMEEMLQVARARQTVDGQYLAGNAASLPVLPKVFDIVDFSLVVHWTNNKPSFDKNGVLMSERARVFKELNRSLKMGGKVAISLPHNYMTAEQFTAWVTALEDFGLRQIDSLPSGEVVATDYKREPISWIFNLEKFEEAHVGNGYDSTLLVLDSDTDYDILGDNKNSSGEGLITTSPPVPHHEFIIITPETGHEEKIDFGTTPQEDKLERDLAKGDKVLSENDRLLQYLGLEEYGMQRRLIREAVRRWEMTWAKAEELSLKVMEVWSQENTRFNYTQQLYGELRNIMLELKENKND